MYYNIMSFLFALSLTSLRSLPSVLICRKTPAFSPEVASWRRAVKNSLNRVGGQDTTLFYTIVDGKLVWQLTTYVDAAFHAFVKLMDDVGKVWRASKFW